MASACVNNTSLGNFFDSPSRDWFNPRSSSKIDGAENKSSEDFEFQLEDSVNMLPADELFSDGKLMPLLNIPTNRSNVISSSSEEELGLKSSISTETFQMKSKILTGMGDPYLFSPKAPRCASGWRELLGLKKLQQQSSKLDSVSKTSKNQNPTSSLKHFRYRNPKSDPSLGLPLLEETDSDRVELPRVSLDSQKSYPSVKRQHNHPPKVRLVRRVQDSNNCNNNTTATTSTISASASAMGVSMDSPRMNSSGKVVFQSLERSSSSPSTFNGGPRIKYKGMERRSYSANVSVTPVLNLNVPVGSLRGSSKFGLGQLFPSHKKGGGGTSADLSDKMRSGQVSKPKPSS